MSLLESLNANLANGKISRMSYLLSRMQIAEQEADQIIASTPKVQWERLRLQAEDMRAFQPRPKLKYHG